MIVESMEKSKPKNFSIRAIISKMDGYSFRFDNSVQRASGQWALKPKSNLISDILQDNPVPNLTFAEQIIDGVVITWNLDGKQRCSTVYDFYNDKFRISRAIRRYNITYQYWDRKNLDANGRPTAAWATFDLRNKRFSDLPSELQERFLNYEFQCTLYLNCSDEDISYHIERYNDGKPMTAAQKGMGVIGTKFAQRTKTISSMPFFMECGDYRASEFRNGTIDKIVVESLIESFYPEAWNKNDLMFNHIKQNAKDEDFDKLEENISRLEEVFDENVSELFTSKDTFIWLAMFEKFTKLGLEDEKFIGFLSKFKESLHAKEIDGRSYDVINEARNTKDKAIVNAKISHLENLMKEYFHLDTTVNLEERFIMDNVGLNEEDIDMELYSQTLDDLEDRVVASTSRLLESPNRLSLLAMAAYGYKNDVDLEAWLGDYASRNNGYTVNQKQNYMRMVEDFENHEVSAA